MLHYASIFLHLIFTGPAHICLHETIVAEPAILSPAPLKISVMVSIFASALSARFNGHRLDQAGFFGEPYSSSP